MGSKANELLHECDLIEVTYNMYFQGSPEMRKRAFLVIYKFNNLLTKTSWGEQHFNVIAD